MDGNEKDELQISICFLKNGLISLVLIVFGLLMFTCIREVSKGLQNIRDSLLILQDIKEEESYELESISEL